MPPIPNSVPRSITGHEKWRLNDFPYKVIYLESPDRLRVVAVMHDSR
ncbi:MAG: hypothetical protein QOD03_886, partial [Verrucomicrobiota bacterium]